MAFRLVCETVRPLLQPTCAIPLFGSRCATGKRGLDPALTLSPRGAIVPFNTTWGRTELNPFRTVKVGNNPPGF